MPMPMTVPAPPGSRKRLHDRRCRGQHHRSMGDEGVLVVTGAGTANDKAAIRQLSTKPIRHRQYRSSLITLAARCLLFRRWRAPDRRWRCAEEGGGRGAAGGRGGVPIVAHENVRA
jgi:hypothetical protein